MSPKANGGRAVMVGRAPSWAALLRAPRLLAVALVQVMSRELNEQLARKLTQGY